VIGNDQWGDKMLQNFEKEGVSTGCLTIVEDEVSSFSIILSASSGERVILYEAGTNEHLHDVTFNKCTASEMDWIYLNHIQETTKVIEDDLIEMLSAPNAPGLTWNPGGSQIIAGCSAGNTPAILSHTDILLLNKTEALEFSKQSSLKSAFETLFAHGPKIICITQGKEGVVASDGTEVLHCPTATDKSVDTTGAGDAFGTGATWAISQGQTLKESLKAGTLNAASVVNAVGSQAGLLTDTKMEENMKSMHLEVSVITL
jgi:sugar/nucleoside kinase (ribokinase family)